MMKAIVFKNQKQKLEEHIARGGVANDYKIIKEHLEWLGKQFELNENK